MADTGVAVGEEFGCFELPIFDLDSGNQVGFGVCFVEISEKSRAILQDLE